jgi:hypothetical protein
MMKFKAVERKKLLIAGGFSLVLGGSGVGAWQFMPGLGVMQPVLAMVGLGKADPGDVKSPATPNGQSDQAVDMAITEARPESFSSKSQLVLAVRSMLNQQTELALGRAGAGSRLKASMGIIATMAQRIDVHQLTPQEYDAAAVYVLSGGRPDFLERIAGEVKLDPERLNLFKGAVAFVRGDLKTAGDELANIHPAKFEPVLAARIYMLQAHLEDKSPYAMRKKMLETAANITLGTLFEEAAIRRLVALAGESGALNDFSYWADRYQRRFPYSPYFPDFWADVLKTVFSLEQGPNKLPQDDLHRLILHLPDDRKLPLMQALIVGSIKGGYPRLCQFGLDEAADSSGKSGTLVEELRLYQLACAVGTDPESVSQKLALLDRKKLDTDALELLDAANLLAQGVLAKGAGPQNDVNTYGPLPGYPGIELVKARAASVAQQLDATDSVLKRAGK